MSFSIIDPENGEELKLIEGQRISVGRDDDIGLQVDVKGVSRVHCVFEYRDGKCTLKDLDSKNGTYVNGKRIKEKELKNGDQVEIAKVKSFSIKGESAAAAVVVAPEGEVDQTPTPADDAFAPKAAEVAAPLPAKVEKPQLASLPPKPVSESKNKSLLGVLIAVSLPMLIALIVYKNFMAPQGPKKNNNQPTPKEKFVSALSDSIQAFKDRDYARAILMSQEASKIFPENESAKIMKDMSEVWQEAEGDHTRLNFTKAEALAKELIDTDKTIKAARDLASETLNWISNEEGHVAKISKLKRLVKAKRWKEASALSDKISKTSETYQNNAGIMEEIESQYREQIRDNALSDFRARRWAQSRHKYTQLMKRLGDEDAKDIKKLIAMTHLREKERDTLNEGLELAKKLQRDQAMALLQLIPQSSPYHEKASKAMRDIDFVQKTEKAKALYHQGKGKEALRFISKERLPISSDEQQHMRDMMRIYAKAEKAFADKKLEEAIKSWSFINENEPYKGNYYRQQSKFQLNNWDEESKIAEQLKAWGDELYRQKKFIEAREFYEDAEGYEEDIAKDVIRKMDIKVTRLFNKAMNTKYKSIPQAKLLLEEIKQLVTPKHKQYEEIQKLYAELNSKKKKQ